MHSTYLLWNFSAWTKCFAQVPGDTQVPKLPMVITMNEQCEFILPVGTVLPFALSPSGQH